MRRWSQAIRLAHFLIARREKKIRAARYTWRQQEYSLKNLIP